MSLKLARFLVCMLVISLSANEMRAQTKDRTIKIGVLRTSTACLPMPAAAVRF
jgi:hypothetical protein